MTSTETSVSPPSGYPAAEWIEDPEDYFHVPADLRQWYADPNAAPSKHQRQRLYQNIPAMGGGPIEVDQIVTDDNGRHIKADPIELSHAAARGLLGPYKAAMVRVDPYASPDAMPYRTWEHDLRLEAANRAAKVDASFEQNYRMELIRVCPICGTENAQHIGMPAAGPVSFSSFMGQQFCLRCLLAVRQVAAERHLQRYRQQVDQWLDDHLPAWEPRPPERMEAQVQQRW